MQREKKHTKPTHVTSDLTKIQLQKPVSVRYVVLGNTPTNARQMQSILIRPKMSTLSFHYCKSKMTPDATVAQKHSCNVVLNVRQNPAVLSR